MRMTDSQPYITDTVLHSEIVTDCNFYREVPYEIAEPVRHPNRGTVLQLITKPKKHSCRGIAPAGCIPLHRSSINAVLITFEAWFFKRHFSAKIAGGTFFWKIDDCIRCMSKIINTFYWTANSYVLPSRSKLDP